jgi:hypothetical protein
MAAFTNFASNKVLDALNRAQALGAPATYYYAMVVANKGMWAAGTVYSIGDYVVTGSPTNNRLYQATVGGTSGATAPTWPTTEGGTVVDNTVTWQEQTLAMNAGTIPEATYAGYARVAVTSGLTEFSGTQGAGTTTVSTGSSGQISNNAVITFGAPTSSQVGLVVGLARYDALTGGNAWDYDISTTPVPIINGSTSPVIAIGSWTFTLVP